MIAMVLEQHGEIILRIVDGKDSVTGIVYLAKENDTSGKPTVTLRHTEKAREPLLAVFPERLISYSQTMLKIRPRI